MEGQEVAAARPATVYLGDVVGNVVYPHTRFRAVQLADHQQQDKVVLFAECSAEDNFKDGESFTVCRAVVVDAYYSTEDQALGVVREMVHYLACHEADEQITYKGNKLYNPHATHSPASRFV